MFPCEFCEILWSTFLIQYRQVTVFKIRKDALKKMLFALDYTNDIKCFWSNFLKLTFPDHTSCKYQQTFLILKVRYHYRCSIQDVSFSLMERSTAIESMIGAFLIVLPFLRIAIGLLLLCPASLTSTSGQSEQNISEG